MFRDIIPFDRNMSQNIQQNVLENIFLSEGIRCYISTPLKVNMCMHADKHEG